MFIFLLESNKLIVVLENNQLIYTKLSTHSESSALQQ